MELTINIYTECKVIIFIFFGYFLTVSNQTECSPEVVCREWQIGSQGGCCYLMTGDKCDNGSRRLCDKNIGYSCTQGICVGRYNLTVAWKDDTSINLTWSSFLPIGSHYNYTVLYSTKLQKDPLMYSSHLVGNKSNYYLQWLTPSTWYYIQVGIWTGETYDNLTEVVIAQTKATDHCLYNGRRVPIGEQLVVDCEESCYCSNTGLFKCVPVCSSQHSSIQPCLETENREHCCDLVHHCSYDSCSYLGESVQHEYSWVIDCAENCTCYDGSVTCVPLCADVMVPENCENAVLTKSSDGCCEEYECPEIETCQHMNTSFGVGEWFEGTECELCTCSPSMEVTCVDLGECLASTLPKPSTTCPEPSVLDNQCCSQIVCEKQTDNTDILSTYSITKYPVSSRILVRFQFISTKDERAAVKMTIFYTNDVISKNYTVWSSNVTVKFRDVIDTLNSTLQYRDFGKPFVLYKINRNYFIVIPNLVVNSFFYFKLKITFDKNQKAIPEYTAETRAIQLPGKRVGAPNHLISRLNRVYFSAMNLSSASALLSWSIPEHFIYNISAFVVKYKSFRMAGWQYTERLIFSDRNFMLKCLFHSSWYEAQLIAHPGERRLATTFFNTSSIKEISNSELFLHIRNISIMSSSVVIRWDPLPVKLAADVTYIEIFWTRDQNEASLLKACVMSYNDFYTLKDLVPGHMYTVWLGISRRDGTITLTNRMHFVSLHQYSSPHSGNQHSIVVAITVACVSLVAMFAAIATVIYLLKCKHRSSYLEHTSFENRIFQIYDNKEDREL